MHIWTVLSRQWALLYLIQLLLVSLALGSITFCFPRLLPIPKLSRFLVGFCLTPFLLSVWMLLTAAVMPGASRWFLLLLPDLAAAGALSVYGPPMLRHVFHLARRGYRVAHKYWPVYPVYIGLVVVLMVLLPKLVQNGRAVVYAKDALVYLSGSLTFARERTLSALTDFRGQPDGSTRGDFHGPIFQAYLGYALINTASDGLIGYPNDHAARAAFQVTLAYMLLAIVALAGAARSFGCGGLALIWLLQVPQWEYVSYQNSRDAFRITPLLLLVTNLCGLAPQRLRRSLPLRTLAFPLILSAYALGGHSLALIVVPLICFAWFIWGVLGKAHWKNIILVIVAIGVGLLLSGSHYIQAYLETGNIRGETDTLNALEGTLLWDIYHSRNQELGAASMPAWQRLAALLERDKYRLSVPGTLTAAFLLVLWIFKPRKLGNPLFFIALLLLGMFIPASGLADTRMYSFSLAFTRNPRYFLHFYPIAAVCIAYGIGSICQHLVMYKVWFTRIPAAISFWLVIGLATYSSYTTISAETWRVSSRNEVWLENLIQPIRAAVKCMPAGRRLITDTTLNYYLDNRMAVLYSKPTWDVIRAKDERQVRVALERLSIGGLVVLDRSIPDFLDRLPLFEFFSNPQNAVLFTRQNGYSVYVLIGLSESKPPEITFSFIDHLDETVGISPHSSTYVRRAVFVTGCLSKQVIFAHPPTQISYRIKIPTRSRIGFSPAISPEVWRVGKGDGVQFDIYIDDGHARRNVFSRYIDPKNIPADRRWHDYKVDLSAWAGQTVTITFATGCGPNDNCDYDWAGWGEPRIVQPIAYNFLDHFPTAEQVTQGLGEVRVVTQTIDYEPRPLLFQHPSSQVAYSLTLPLQSTLYFGYGMAPEVWSPDKGDGVEYNIYVQRSEEPYTLYRVFHHYIDPKNNLEDRRWFDERVDLSRFGGQTVKIIFEALPGPAGNASYDWGGWSAPVLVDETLPSENIAGPTAPSRNVP